MLTDLILIGPTLNKLKIEIRCIRVIFFTPTWITNRMFKKQFDFSFGDPGGVSCNLVLPAQKKKNFFFKKGNYKFR
jgi:hypothetical protein